MVYANFIVNGVVHIQYHNITKIHFIVFSENFAELNREKSL